MPKISILSAVKQLKRPVFTTRDIAAYAGSSASNAIQALNNLSKAGVVVKISRGIWAIDMGGKQLSQHAVVPYLLPSGQAYVSFVSALHLYGIIEQIPQAVTVASTGHTRTIRTKLGVFYVHRIAPSFFKGFDWYKGEGSFLIAEPEKALVDCLYLSARKKKQFGYFPELRFPKQFSFKKAADWARRIPDCKIRSCVTKALDRVRTTAFQRTTIHGRQN